MLEETRPDGHGRAKGLVSSRESGRRVDARTFAPSAALRGVVEAYWVTRWDLHDQPPHVAELLTDPCVSVVLEAGQSRVVGVSTRLFRRELRERGLMRAVKLRAGAARALLGDVPLVSLSDRRVPFAELLGAAPEALEAQVLGEADDTRALAALEAWLHARLRRPLDPKVTLAAGLVERATREPELRTVDALARAGGLTVRPLQRLFRDYVGASPKWGAAAGAAADRCAAARAGPDRVAGRAGGRAGLRRPRPPHARLPRGHGARPDRLCPRGVEVRAGAARAAPRARAW